LPIPSFAHIAVDAAAGYVFATGGSGTSGVVVRDLSGKAVKTIAGESGADGLVVSPDGATVYVALRDDSAISAIDTTSLTESARYSTGGNVCPSTLAVLGTKIWFGYGCTSGSAGIGVLDLGVSPATVHTGLATMYDPPILTTSTALPDELIAGQFGGSELDKFDISGTSLTMAAHVGVGENLKDLKITPDGSQVLTASGGEYDIAKYSTADLSKLGQYGAQHPYPDAVAVSSSGQVLAGMDAPYDPDVRSYAPDGQQLTTFDFNRSDSGETLVDDGLAIDGSGARLYAVTSSYPGGAGSVRLYVVTHPLTPKTTLTVSVPQRARRGSTVHMSGTINAAGTPISAARVTVARKDASGTHSVARVTSDSHGRFSFTDRPTVGGGVAYVASYDGDKSHLAASRTARITVSRANTTLRVSSGQHYGYRGLAKVRVHLGKTYNGHTVAVYATPYGGARKLIRSVHADRHGDATVSYRIVERTKFTAVFAGDYRYTPLSASATSLAAAKVVTAIAKRHGKRGKYALYGHNKGARIAAQALPLKSGECLTYILQRYTPSGWRTGASGCFTLDSVGVVAGIVKGAPGYKYRAAVEFRGDKANTAAASRWYYLEFT
jgi:YVTN family beta-propeller protein